MQRGDVRKTDEGLWMGGDGVKVQVRDHFGRAGAAAQALDGIDRRVGKQRHEVPCAGLGATCGRACPFERSWCERDVIAVRVPPRHATAHIRVGGVGAGRAGDANGAPWREGWGM